MQDFYTRQRLQVQVDLIEKEVSISFLSDQVLSLHDAVDVTVPLRELFPSVVQ